MRRFQFTAIFNLLLLNALASSFGSNNPKKIHHRSSSSSYSSRIPFVVSSGGASNHVFGTATTSTTTRMSASSAAAVEEEVTSENLELLSERGKNAILSLIESDVDGIQRHVYGDWPESGIEDEGKKQLAEQVSSIAVIKNLPTLFHLYLYLYPTTTKKFENRGEKRKEKKKTFDPPPPSR
jgi:hypothetical protein